MVEHVLDTSGTVCPMPAFKTRKELKALQPDDVLIVKGDFVPAVENIERVATQDGGKIVSRQVSGDRFEIVIRKQ
ncbi:MAG: sulfurtransferase TusA family protein [Candidatus Lokiarchaeota archaeon]|nr:sulfurtransferase TusA family protein [Candidatus Lokiarchaeota archaeon]